MRKTRTALQTDERWLQESTQAGYALPYGDYFSMAVDGQNNTQIAWGEGPSYASPGNQWVSHSIND